MKLFVLTVFIMLSSFSFCQDNKAEELLMNSLNFVKPVTLQQLNQIIADKNSISELDPSFIINNRELIYIGQIGNDNYAVIEQEGNNNSITIGQQGNGNNAAISLQGLNNKNAVVQMGNYNIYSLGQKGNNAEVLIEQYGYNNNLMQNFSGDKFKFTVSQTGNNHDIIQIENSETAKEYSIYQKGEGMKLIIIYGAVYR